MLRVLLLALYSSVACASAATSPNMVLIVAEDLGIYDLSCYGRVNQPTPHLDQLAVQGMRFTSAYAAAPLAAPARAALLTGKSPARLHFTVDVPGRADKPSQKLLQPEALRTLPLDETTLAEALQPAGYATAFIGPWLLGTGAAGPAAQGYDFVFGSDLGPLTTPAEAAQREADLTTHAVSFIEAQRSKPFLLCLAYSSPHVPLDAQPPRGAKLQAVFNPPYAAAVVALDEAVGRVLQRLEELQLADRTMVVVTSSNGGLHVPVGTASPATYNGEFRAGKGYLYEGGLRVPLLVRWPGKVAPGQVCATPVAQAGLLATLAEAAGVAKPPGLDFASFTASLQGSAEEKAAEFYWHFPHYSEEGSRPGGALRAGAWKLVENYEDGSAELYNLANDPGEKTNLNASEPARVAELRGQLATWRESVTAQENQANPAFQYAWHTEIYGETDASLLPHQKTAEAMREPLVAWRKALDRPPTGIFDLATAPGFLVLPAREAIVHGTALRYEPQPFKNTLGFWKYAADTASWNVTLPAAGRYAVEALVGCGKGSGGATVEIDAGKSSISFRVAETGHFQNFVPQRVGSLRLQAGLNTLTVTPRSKPGAAVMDLRQLMLTKLSD